MIPTLAALPELPAWVTLSLAAIMIALSLLSLVLVCLTALAVRWPARFEAPARWYYFRTAAPVIEAYGRARSRIVFGSLRSIEPDRDVRRILVGAAIRLARGEAPQDVWDLMQRIADDVELRDLGPRGLELDRNARTRIHAGICRLCDRGGLPRPAYEGASKRASECTSECTCGGTR